MTDQLLTNLLATLRYENADPATRTEAQMATATRHVHHLLEREVRRESVMQFHARTAGCR